MTHTIIPTAEGLLIHATADPATRDALLEEFARCAAGTCTCPSPQYEKLASMDVRPGPEGVTVELKARPGETLETADIERCLEHTQRQIAR